MSAARTARPWLVGEVRLRDGLQLLVPAPVGWTAAAAVVMAVPMAESGWEGVPVPVSCLTTKS